VGECGVELDREECLRRLGDARHAVLGTVHPNRGVDAVPTVFAMAGDTVLLPVDTVKPKHTPHLRRLRNLEEDARCVLLAEHYTDDWSQLWWVRVHGRASQRAASPADRSAFAARYQQYRAPDTIVLVVEMTVDEIIGWSAT
jgi:PPOX class probable F420-dependent enzyme